MPKKKKADRTASSIELHSRELLGAAKNDIAVHIDDVDEYSDQITIFEQHQVQLPRTQEYQAWFSGEVDRLKGDKESTGFISVFSMSPSSSFDVGEYIHAFIFENHSFALHWLSGPERAKWIKAAADAQLFEQRGHDIQEGGVSYLPESMLPAARAMAEMNATEQDRGGGGGGGGGGEAGAALTVGCCKTNPSAPPPTCCGHEYNVGPPPAWRNVLAIWFGACMAFIPCAYFVVAHLYAPFVHGLPGEPCRFNATITVPNATARAAPDGSVTVTAPLTFENPCGHPPVNTSTPFWGFLLTVFIVNWVVMYIVMPIVNLGCRPFLQGIPNFRQCGMDYEPFTTLDEGLPCFRPRAPAWQHAVDGLREATETGQQAVVASHRRNANNRRRMLARFERIEKRLAGLQSGGAGAGDLEVATPGRARVDTAVRKDIEASAAKIAATIKGSEGEVSLVLKARVRAKKALEAEEHVEDIFRVAFRRGAGDFLGGIIIRPERGAEHRGDVLVYYVIFKYRTAAAMKEWLDSDERLVKLAEGKHLFAGRRESYEGGEVVRVHDSISSLFALPAVYHHSGKNQSQEFEWHPKTWKMYLAMNLAFVIVGYPMGDLWLLHPMGPLIPLLFQGVPLAVLVMINVLILVVVVVYVAVPVVIWLLGHWLFVPWIKSKNPVIAVLEEGFPCCLADGKKPGSS